MSNPLKKAAPATKPNMPLRKPKRAPRSDKSESRSRKSKGKDFVECREPECERPVTTSSYCRLHYIKNWKRIKRKEFILKGNKLSNYIEELVAKYPDKYIEIMRNDLSSDLNFSKVIADMDLTLPSRDALNMDEEFEDFVSSLRNPAGLTPDDEF